MLSGLTSFLPESTLTLYDNLEFLFRILLATVLGAAIGLERTKRQKEAGVRTHCIIACASAVFMILSKYAFIDTAALAGSLGADAARIAAQVVSGISFLGAGVIFKNGSSIRGLTTAAGMWGTAAVGMAIGAGLYWLGLMEAVVLVVIQLVLHRFPVGGDAETTQEVTVHMEDSEDLMRAFDRLVEGHKGKITDSTLTRENGLLCLEVSIRLPDPITHQEALAFLKENPGVRKISV
jgi:putative Mg2+ transporter-C (MgtC) family protein